MSKNQNEVDPFAGLEEQEVVYNNLKFGQVGDWFKGTLIDNTKQIPNQLSQKKEMQTVFVFKAKGGSFHDIVKRKVQDEATVINKDEEWSYITGKSALLSQLNRAQIGQVVGLRFAEIKEATQPGYDDTKIIKVYLGEMDPEYSGE